MHLKPTATLSYAQLDTNLHNLNKLLKSMHDYQPETKKYKQWKETELDFLEEQYTTTQKLIDAKLALIPVEVLLAAIEDTTIAIEMPEKF